MVGRGRRITRPRADPRRSTDGGAVLRAPDNGVRLASDGAEVVASSPEEFAAFLKAETVKMAKVVQAAGIQAE